MILVHIYAGTIELWKSMLFCFLFTAQRILSLIISFGLWIAPRRQGD